MKISVWFARVIICSSISSDVASNGQVVAVCAAEGTLLRLICVCHGTISYACPLLSVF